MQPAKTTTYRPYLQLILLKILLSQRREEEHNLSLDDGVDIGVGRRVHFGLRSQANSGVVNWAPSSTATGSSAANSTARFRRLR